MFGLILGLAMAASLPPADEWRDYPSNPAWEMFGHTDEHGVFRYTEFRQKARRQAGAMNYGVDLGGEDRAKPPNAGEVAGTDFELARELAEREVQHKSGAATASGDGPCPGPGPCPQPNGPRRPHEPDMPEPFPIPSPLPFSPHLLFIGGGVLALIGVGFVFIVITFVLVSRGRGQS